MTEKILKFIFVGIVVIGVVATGIYYAFIYLMGYNFVHDKQARTSPQYSRIENVITFTTKYHGDKFNSLLDSFLKRNPQYAFTVTSNTLDYTDSCYCNGLRFTRIIYFESPPREAYQITFDYDTTEIGAAGIINVVFKYKNSNWVCSKSSNLDSIEKNRIENRFDTAILEKLK